MIVVNGGGGGFFSMFILFASSLLFSLNSSLTPSSFLVLAIFLLSFWEV